MCALTEATQPNKPHHERTTAAAKPATQRLTRAPRAQRIEAANASANAIHATQMALRRSGGAPGRATATARLVSITGAAAKVPHPSARK